MNPWPFEPSGTTPTHLKMIHMSKGPESFKKCFGETVHLTIGDIRTDDQRLGFLNFFCKFGKIIFDFANVVRNTFFTGHARSDVNIAKLHKFGFQSASIRYSFHQSIRITVFLQDSLKSPILQNPLKISLQFIKLYNITITKEHALKLFSRACLRPNVFCLNLESQARRIL